jgi:hypothetical protein
VIIASLSLLLIPKLTAIDPLEEQLRTDFEYLKTLALSDDPYHPSDGAYFKKYWQIIFAKSSYTNGYYTYTIFKDHSGNQSGNPDISEIAKDPLDGSKLLTGGYSGVIRSSDLRTTKRMQIGQHYGVVDLRFEGGCRYYSSKRLAFDPLARPLKGNLKSYKYPYHHLMSEACEIYLCLDIACESYKKVTIQPYSGMVEVSGS